MSLRAKIAFGSVWASIAMYAIPWILMATFGIQFMRDPMTAVGMWFTYFGAYLALPFGDYAYQAAMIILGFPVYAVIGWVAYGLHRLFCHAFFDGRNYLQIKSLG